MKDALPTILTLITAIVILSIVGGTTYSCARSNGRYYDAMSDCIAHGGTFIPTNFTNGAACVSPNR